MKTFSYKLFTIVLIALSLLVLIQPRGVLASHIPGHVDPNPNPDAPSTTEFASAFEGIGVRFGDCGLDPVCHFTKALKMIITALLVMIGGFFAKIFVLFTGFAQAMIIFGTQLTNLEIVKVGFKITLTLTNVFFVASIIFAAIVTIIGSTTYNGKKILKNLIIAALLINFSLLFAGIILDISNVFTAGFANKFNPDDIGAAFQPQRLIFATTGVKPGDNLPGGGWVREQVDGRITFGVNDNDAGWVLILKIWQGLLFSVLMTFLLMLTMIAMSIGILIRNLYICGLLIVMPIAWAFWALPVSQLKSAPDIKKWFDIFIEKAIYLPTVTFFIWLVVNTSAVMFAANSPLLENASKIGASIGVDSIFIVLFQQLIIIGFLVMGLKAASGGSKVATMFGIGAAGLVAGKIMGFGKGVVKGTVGRVVDTGRSVGGAAIAGAGALAGGAAVLGGKKIFGFSQKKFKGGGVAGKILGSIGAGVGSAVVGLGGATRAAGAGAGGVVSGKGNKAMSEGAAELFDPNNWKSKEATERRAKKASEELKDKSNDELLDVAREGGGSTAEKLALLRKLQEKKLLGEFKTQKEQEALMSLFDAAEKAGAKETSRSAQKAAMAANPSLVPKLMKNDQAYAGMSDEQMIGKFLGGLNAEDLGKLKIDKLDTAAQEQIAKALAKLPMMASRFANASADSITAVMDKLLAIVGNPQIMTRPVADVRKDFDAMLRANANNATQSAQIKEKMGAYEALLRINQTPGA